MQNASLSKEEDTALPAQALEWFDKLAAATIASGVDPDPEGHTKRIRAVKMCTAAVLASLAGLDCTVPQTVTSVNSFTTMPEIWSRPPSLAPPRPLLSYSAQALSAPC